RRCRGRRLDLRGRVTLRGPVLPIDGHRDGGDEHGGRGDQDGGPDAPVDLRHGESNSVMETGRSPRSAIALSRAGIALTVPTWPQCIETIDPGRSRRIVVLMIAAAPGSV